MAALSVTLAAAAGFGLRWLAEPAPPSVREIAQARRSAEKLALQVKDLKRELVLARQSQSAAEQALAGTEKALSELKADQSAESRTGIQGQTAQLGAPDRRLTKSMPCDLSGNRERMAQELKDCVRAFESLNR